MAQHDEGDQGQGLERLLASATSIIGAGAGAGISLLTGEPISGAMVGQALAEVGHDIARRVLSPRQEERVGTVLVLAAGAVVANETMGMPVRDDGFFDGERSDAEEVVESVLTLAMKETQERKLPYIANMLAAIACMSHIDVSTANRMIRESEHLTWLDLRILGIVSRPDKFPLPDTDLPNTSGASWNDWTVFQAASSLRSENGFLSYPRQAEPSRTGIALFDLRMSKLGLSSMGNLMVATMKLNEIPAADLRPIYEALCRVPERQTEDPDARR